MIAAIVQARLTSTRLPNKVLKTLDNSTVIGVIVERLKRSKKIDQVIVSIPKNDANKELRQYLEQQGYDYFTGSEDNVLERIILTAQKYSIETVIRITGDCPFVDSGMIDEYIDSFNESKCDYLSNTNPPTYPDGLDIEIIKRSILEQIKDQITDSFDLEHVTTFIKKNDQFKKINVVNDSDLSKLRWTLDESSDYEVIKNIFNHFKPNIFFNWKDIINLYKTNKDLFLANQHLTRNETSNMSSGQKLYKKAKQLIPGGNMLLSKRPEMFLPDLWPAYYSKSQGCYVWDLDNTKFIDVSIMGVGTNTLGYNNKRVDQAVLNTIKAGNMTTLNCPEEVYLAEKLVEIHPWSEMVKFARTGGEANAIAIRIARAASGKDNVAICGYHGWHDWYLSANLGRSKDLDGHLLPGLEPNGVPRSLKDTTFSFQYNDLNQLKDLIATKDIGVIKMEVMRNDPPKDNFLEQVRDLATQNNIVLIFDECTSGFRETFGGIHQKFKVDPDICILGKALGNGYAITSIVGRREVMDYAQSSFISSTFWTERIGPSAALESLNVMQDIKSWEFLTKTGQYVKQEWQKIFNSYNLDFKISGIDPLPVFSSEDKNFMKYKTLITYEMLQRGFLASNALYICTEHSKEIMNKYLESFEEILSIIAKCIHDDQDIDSLIAYPISHSGFSRLN